jgi:hypothetical protein
LLTEPLRVLDLYSGEGRIWQAMREHFTVAAYTPVDKKPRQPGAIRMTVDGRTAQAFDPKKFNVIDIDSYGEPWEVWNALQDRISSPTAVFFTYGHVGLGSIQISNYLKRANGIPQDWNIPSSVDLARFLGHSYLMRSLYSHKSKNFLAVDNPNVSYYGALLVTI